MILKITFHNSHYKYTKKINKKFVSSKKNLTFALEMFETTMNSGKKVIHILNKIKF